MGQTFIIIKKKVIRMNSTLEIINLGSCTHVGQPICGLLAVAKKLNFKVKVINDDKYRNFGSLLVVNFPGIGLLGFDMADGYNFDLDKYDKIIEPMVGVFKRSFSKEQNSKLKNGHKIMPYGLNYRIDPPLLKYRGWMRKKSLLATIVKAVIGYEKFTYNPIDFVCDPTIKDNVEKPRIIYMARLWDPNEGYAGKPLSKELMEERNSINEFRMAVVRELRNKYGDAFVGGIERSTYSEQLCPELIVDKKYTAKNHYLKLMKTCDICIATTGLHKSIGWKTGEYIAAGKAVITEKLNYEVPSLYEGVNYLTFSTVDECVKQIDVMLDNKDLLKQMKQANRLYYITNLEPESLIKNCFARLLNKMISKQ